MNTGKQVNAMVVVLFLLVISAGVYTVWDPFRSENAEEDQVAMAAERAGTTFALNCRLCHGDRGQGGVSGGRLAAALALDTERLQGISGGRFNQAAFDDAFKFVTNTVTCGRAGTALPIWGATQGGPLNEEQVRQLAVLITEGRFWDLAREHADELDAEATGHATVQMPDGVLGATATELVVSNAAAYSEGQFVRIRIPGGEGEEERLLITEVPGTGQRLVHAIGKTPDEFLVSGAAGIEVGTLIRLDGELMEVTAIRDGGDPGIELNEGALEFAGRISVSDPAFFDAGYVLRIGDELIEVIGPPDTGQTLGETIGRAETSFTVSGTAGIEPGMVIRVERELLRVVEVTPAQVEIKRGVDDTAAASHGAATAILEIGTGTEEEAADLDTGQALIEAVDSTGTVIIVDGTAGIVIGVAYQLGDEIVRVTEIQPARLRVERGVEGTSRAEHSRRVSIFEGDLLDVRRAFGGTSADSHSAGDPILLTELEVKRAAGDSQTESHGKNATIYLGHRLLVERGVRGTEPADHANGELVLDFPPPPDEPAIVQQSCGQRAQAPSDGAPTGPTPTPVAGAQRVAVSLFEFDVEPETTSIAAGPVEFRLTNDGTIQHNFRVISTDLAPDALPVDDATFAVDEDQVDVVASSAVFDTGEELVVAADLPAGNYVLICNIPSHYENGMTVGFEVTAP